MSTLAEVSEFLNKCIIRLGLGFNPDNDFNDYCNGDMPIYGSLEAATLNIKMYEAFAVCHAYQADIHQLAIETPEYVRLINILNGSKL